MGILAHRESPDFVAIGHVTIDITPTPAHPEGERRYGGAAAYAALTAASMGLNAAVLTSASHSYPFAEIMPGVAVANVASPNTTTFQNLYQAGKRKQLLAARAGDIANTDLPDYWNSPPIVVICPLARELPADAYSWFRQSTTTTGLVLQGYFRHWDGYGVVNVQPELPPSPATVKSRGVEARAALAIASHDELSAQEARAWNDIADVVVRTRGPEGAELYIGRDMSEVAAPPADEIDPTGAGDVWAAAYLIRLRETGDIESAARFASAAASLSVTGTGLSGIPGRKNVEETVVLQW